ncbi:hypothetical protein ACNQVK_27505 [Mycobacterium sp. 134]|uniref:hypothetical protein n=1 Tax=Mycobacterium sp. 134 TaxID=3400425 RepID=UPI003AADF965
MSDNLESALERSRKAILENLERLLTGDNSVNRHPVEECLAALADMITVVGEAFERFEKNALEIRGVFVPGELSQLEQHRDLLVETFDLLADKVSIAPDLYKRDGTVTFQLGQVCRTGALEALAGITRERSASMGNPDVSLGAVLAEFSGVIGGFLVGEIDPAVRILQDLPANRDQTEVVVGNRARSRLTEMKAARVSEIEDIAERSLENIRAAAHGVGVGRLAKDFESGRDTEKEGAKFWTTAVFLCVAAAVSLPILILSVDTHLFSQLSGPTGVAIKALIGLPFLGLAGYCARIASQHREAARHLAILTTQMDALRAYVDGLPAEDQREITMILGRRAFSNPELGARDSGQINALPDDAAKALEKAFDLAKDALKRSQ